MLEWASASELIDLPGLPKSGPRLKQYLRDLANEHLIRPRTRATGGRPELEYPVWILPDEARVELASRQMQTVDASRYSLAAAMLRVTENTEKQLAPSSESFTRGNVSAPSPRLADSAFADATAPPNVLAAAVPFTSTPQHRAAEGSEPPPEGLLAPSAAVSIPTLSAATVPRNTTPLHSAKEGSARPPKAYEPPAVAAGNYLTLSDSARARVDAKAELLTTFTSFRRIAGTALDVAALEFAKAYNAGQIEVTDAVRIAMRGRALTVPTLLRWRRESKKEGIAKLGGNYGNRKGAGLIDSTPEIRDLIVAMIHERPNYVGSPGRIFEGLKARFNGAAPHLKQVQRFVKRYAAEHGPELLAIANPDASKSRHRLALADAAADIVRPNQEVQIDGTPGDVMCADGRYYVMTAIDVFTRRAKVRISKTATSADAAILVRRVIKAWGVPETIHGDNGKEFVAHHLQRVLMDLGIEYIASTPFSPEQKPFIERFNGTLMHTLFEMLPGYIGHNVADRKAIESRKTFAARLGDKDEARFNVKLSADELQVRCDEWCDHVYGDRPHSGLNGRSPNQVAAQWVAEGGAPPRRIKDERALDLLLGRGEVRRVGKKGIRVASALFWHVDLVPFVGHDVLTIPDDDMGRVYVYSQEPRAFVCVAENLDRMGQSRTELVIKSKAAQTVFNSELRKSARRGKTIFKPERIADEIIAHGIANASPTQIGASVLHETAALLAATAAHEADSVASVPRKPRYDAERLEQGKQIVQRLAHRATDDRDDDEADWNRFERLSAADIVSDDDRAWMRSFQNTSVYRARTMLKNARGSKIASVG
jgi:putative transposase